MISWPELWSFGRFELELGEEEFWEETSWPEFAALTDRWEKRNALQNYRAGLAAAVIKNLFLPRHKQMEALDFFRDKKTQQPRQSPKQMLEVMKAFTLAHGGKVRNRKKDGDSR